MLFSKKKSSKHACVRPIMAANADEVDADVVAAVLRKMTKDELEKVLRPITPEICSRITSEKVLLNLYSNEAINWDEKEDMEAKGPPKRSVYEAMLRTIINKEEGENFIRALKAAGQGHIIKIIAEELERQKSAANDKDDHADDVENPSQSSQAQPESGREQCSREWTRLLNALDDSKANINLFEAMEQHGDLLDRLTSPYELDGSGLDGGCTKKRGTNCYQLGGPGQVLIINNKFDTPAEYFDQSMRDMYNANFRKGADADGIALKKLCTVLEIPETGRTYLENVKAGDVKEILKKYQKKCETSKAGYSLVFLMTHGGSEADSLLMDDLREIHLSRDLVHQFDANTFHYGSKGCGDDGFPKLFFVQACRNYENRIPMPKLKMDSTVLGDGDDTPFKLDDDKNLFGDLMLGQSVIPLHVSYRDGDFGSFYVQAIASVFQQYHQKMDLLTMVQKSGKLVTDLCLEYNRSRLDPTKRIVAQQPVVSLVQFKKDFFF